MHASMLLSLGGVHLDKCYQEEAEEASVCAVGKTLTIKAVTACVPAWMIDRVFDIESGVK